MKQIRLRIEVTAEDSLPIDAAQQALRKILEAAGVQHLGEHGEGDLAGDRPAPRIFWMTADIKQGADRAEPPVVKPRSRAK